MTRIRGMIVITGAAALILATGSGVAAASVISGGSVKSAGVSSKSGGLNVTVATNHQTNIGT